MVGANPRGRLGFGDGETWQGFCDPAKFVDNAPQFARIRTARDSHILSSQRVQAMLEPMRRWSIRWHLLPSAILAAGVLLAPYQAAAEIILDDFDEPFEIVLPHPGFFNPAPVVQFGVGPLGVERHSAVNTLSSGPTGRLDANISRASALTFALDRLNPTSAEAPVVALSLRYFFDEMDVTQGGANDRIAVDFSHLRSAIPLAHAYVFVEGRGIGHGGVLSSVPPSDEPFTLEFPFDATQFDAIHVSDVIVNISPVYFSGPDEIHFSAAVERIRFTSAIPEPATSVLVVFCTFPVMWSLARKRRRRHAGENYFSTGRNAGRCSSQ